MRSEWKLWKELIGKETGLGWDPRLETVDASPDWWKTEIQMNKEYIRFQKKGIDPDIVSKNDFMFGSTVATGEFAWAPSSDADAKKDQNEDDIISLNDSADDPLQKSMDRFIEEEDIILDDNSNIGKKRRTHKKKY
ncbi:hypothetical protein DCAR_0728902 [Daucus carota subsp. sativus]|uniref:Myb/SANT-like domain-containing protein n=1 Tax=Daucus carota subsp. sativus TaxID=79200 RepID=A0AAF0XKH2_DAUCS|nr:hypothetical protein DCAR_0728902 [Daucus carota subsp. sativus]